MRDASLDEFASGGDDGEATDSDASSVDDPGDASGDASDGTSASGDEVAESMDEVDGVADGESSDEVDGAAEGTEASAGGGGGADAMPAVDADAVEEAHPTYVRDPDGGTCADCGEQVERRWTGEAGLVCPACKDW